LNSAKSNSNLFCRGRLKSEKELFRFEIFSILITAVYIIIVLTDFWTIIIPNKIITYALYSMNRLVFIEHI